MNKLPVLPAVFLVVEAGALFEDCVENAVGDFN